MFLLLRSVKYFVVLICFSLGCTQVKFEVGKRNEEKMLRNTGIVESLQNSLSVIEVTPQALVAVFGVHIDSSGITKRIISELKEESQREGVICRYGEFTGYDQVMIPFYEMLPPDFDDKKKYPTVIMFSGHGDMDQVAHEKWTYQKGVGLRLAKNGFVVYTMENRGMGALSNLGDHLKIDAVARLTGGSWYGELLTDGLYLVEMVLNKPYVDQNRLGAGGVSTGGALSMLIAAIDSRITATYVQGYLGSYKTTFGTHSNHHICNNIAGILNHFDMQDIAASIAPRSAMYVNGERDTFYYQDAQTAFNHIKTYYDENDANGRVSLVVPENTIHELSSDLIQKFFTENLK